MENEEKVYARGYKGFSPDMVCAPDDDHRMQYAENTVFEVPEAEICKSGMHFCTYPLEVFRYYPPSSEFAMVEALAPVFSDDNEKFCTTKLRVKSKINLAQLCNKTVDFINQQSAATNTGYQSAATNTGYQSAATNTGDWSAATNTGYQSAATNTGDWSAAIVNGKESFAISTGYKGKAKGVLGCWIACAEWAEDDKGEYHPINFKVAMVDGEKIKENTFYRLKNNQFIEASES